jgi:beta-glucosidase
VRHARAGTDAGLDVEMPFTLRYGRRLKKLVLKGEVSEDTIDESVTRIIRQKARFAGVGDPAGYHKGKVACKEHVALALEAARKSIVLLKNENHALPLNRDELKTIAVIGEPAGKANLGDNGSSQVYPPYSVSPLKGIRERAGASIKIICSNGKDVMDARKTVRGADAVIVVAGFTHKDEGEHIPVLNIGGDRTSLDLPAGQEILIRAAAEENKRVIVVLEGGSAITMESWKDKVQAILMAWYPGMEGGAAIADVLFGDVNPSGKLPCVFPRSMDQLPRFDKKAKSIEYGYFHGYRLFDKEGLEPAFPFGFGLSYTQYRYHNLKLSRKSIGKNGRIDVSVDVTNAGETAGDEIVQLYAGCNDSAVERPVKDLKGFRRITLEPGETKTLTMEVGAADLAYYDVDSSSWKIEEKEYTIYVGPSSNRKDLIEDGFKISGD